MNNWGANHGAISYGHIGADLITMASMLRIPVCMHNVANKDIFRPDEIWFAQKDVDQATKLYPLSDFNVHKTANLENGYLAGRYGGVPFLSNLNDLHW